jgi:hypothetical protein
MSRQRPWRADNPDAVIVSRPSKWGNPFRIEDAMEAGYADTEAEGRVLVVDTFREWLVGDTWAQPFRNAERLKMLADLQELDGRDIACWCPLDQPCHGDVLLKLANGDPS